MSLPCDARYRPTVNGSDPSTTNGEQSLFCSADCASVEFFIKRLTSVRSSRRNFRGQDGTTLASISSARFLPLEREIITCPRQMLKNVRPRATPISYSHPVDIVHPRFVVKLWPRVHRFRPRDFRSYPFHALCSRSLIYFLWIGKSEIKRRCKARYFLKRGNSFLRKLYSLQNR